MPEVISSTYLDRLCADRDYDGLTWLSSVLCASHRFNPTDPTYGLPAFAFVLVERLAWFAQGIRSGAWTYYEATPPERQIAMLAKLNEDSEYPEFADRYQFGIREWHTPTRLTTQDAWLDTNDDLNNLIAWRIVSDNREGLQGLVNVDA